VKSGEEFLKVTKAARELDEKIDHAFVEGGEKFLETTGAALELDKKIDRAYVTSGKRFVSEISKEESEEEESYSYLREPLTIFDQSAEDFFSQVAADVIDAVKYPYALVSYLIDFAIDKKDQRKIEARALDFEKTMEKFVEETPNISGISIAVFIIAGMLAIYLFTAVV
jgi:hypothetical protein